MITCNRQPILSAEKQNFASEENEASVAYNPVIWALQNCVKHESREAFS